MKFCISLISILVWIAGLWLFIPLYEFLTGLHKFVGGLSIVYLSFCWLLVIMWLNYKLYE